MRYTVTLVLAVILGTLPLCTGCKKTKEEKIADAKEKLREAIKNDIGFFFPGAAASDKVGTLFSNMATSGLGDGQTTVLHVAVSFGKSDIVKDLIDAGVDINAKDAAGNAPLHMAVTSERATCCLKTLLDAGADPNAKNQEGYTALHLTLCDSYQVPVAKAVRILIAAKADINCRTPYDLTPLHYVAWHGDKAGGVEAAKLLITAGADINAVTDDKSTPMHYAAMYGNRNILETLIESHAEVNCRDEEGYTPLLVAADYAMEECVKSLLNANADYTARTKEGWSVLSFLADRDCRDFDLLIAKGAKEPTWTELHYAAIRGDEAAVKKALASGEHLNKEDALNRTPLMWAILCNNNEVVQKLLAAGARTDIRDINGATLLHTAIRGMKEDLIPKLIGAGLNVNATDKDGWTPLHYSAFTGYLKASKLLIAAKAHSDVPTKNGTRPLLLALKNMPTITDEETRAQRDDYEEIAAILIEAGAELVAINSSGEKTMSYLSFKNQERKERLSEYLQYPVHKKLESILSYYADLDMVNSIRSIATDTPEGVLRKMIRSLYAGQSEQFASCFSGSEEDIENARSIGEFLSKTFAFRKAMIAEYGTDGWLEFLDQEQYSMDYPIWNEQEIESLSLDNSKDRISVPTWRLSTHADQDLILRKTTNGWRLEFSSFIDTATKADPESLGRHINIYSHLYSEGLASIGKPGMTPQSINAKMGKIMMRLLFSKD